jgi:hypothetical protein
MATIQQLPAHPAVSDEVPNVTSHTGLSPQMGAADPGTATPVIGRADPGTIAPLMGSGAPGTAIPLVGPADPGGTPLMRPARQQSRARGGLAPNVVEC